MKGHCTPNVKFNVDGLTEDQVRALQSMVTSKINEVRAQNERKTAYLKEQDSDKAYEKLLKANDKIRRVDVWEAAVEWTRKNYEYVKVEK